MICKVATERHKRIFVTLASLSLCFEGALLGFFAVLFLAKGAIFPSVNAKLACMIIAGYLAFMVLFNALVNCVSGCRHHERLDDSASGKKKALRCTAFFMGVLATATGFCMAFIGTSMFFDVSVLPFDLSISRPVMYGILGGCAAIFCVSMAVWHVMTHRFLDAVGEFGADPDNYKEVVGSEELVSGITTAVSACVVVGICSACCDCSEQRRAGTSV